MKRRILVDVETDPNESDSLLKLTILLAEWLEKQKEKRMILKYGIGFEVGAQWILENHMEIINTNRGILKIECK